MPNEPSTHRADLFRMVTLSDASVEVRAADATDGRRVMLDKAGVALTVEGPCQMTVTGPDGIKVWIGRGAAPGDYQDGSASSGCAP